MSNPILTALQRATVGLQFPSEPAAPLEPFVWDEAALTPAAIRLRAGQPVQARCQTITARPSSPTWRRWRASLPCIRPCNRSSPTSGSTCMARSPSRCMWSARPARTAGGCQNPRRRSVSPATPGLDVYAARDVAGMEDRTRSTRGPIVGRRSCIPPWPQP